MHVLYQSMSKIAYSDRQIHIGCIPVAGASGEKAGCPSRMGCKSIVKNSRQTGSRLARSGQKRE
jgi:hypothetical protein